MMTTSSYNPWQRQRWKEGGEKVEVKVERRWQEGGEKVEAKVERRW
jgi:hypothetical protein